ncbi:hypothetical protein [Denitromonas ohlonensis]|uniref:Uncharacterized protein n=2 Tax=Denitromonas TaxID=139331 RepID=A0A558CIB2_9RHOO|nr:hypothetical protein [Denitromonas ohlonensis]TVT48500.1 MAG: hypothetical protein FHP94_10240 [Denitromonas halophila]TVO69424.1 hypothetical protein FHP90_02270 [Denitromonas ohlonensis]TVO77524.1 hypothetical protein FHP89_09500 [Denitromonas ohlonensis]TVT73081.1 MAG: hypothetical protein FHP93_06795 [Denitromonas halophila]TVT74135.1 MAG: hypothetical protein FHP92_14360 [Denitromonas halophila]
MMQAYAKTAKGVAEVETRADRLKPALRRLLILVDGKKPLDALKSMIGNDAIDEPLTQLVEGGYIEAIEAANDAAADLPGSSPPAFDVAMLPAERDAKALDKARNYMINTLKHFHGPYTKLDLMRLVQASETHAQLRTHYADWLRCMHESTMAERRLNDLNRELFEVL